MSTARSQKRSLLGAEEPRFEVNKKNRNVPVIAIEQHQVMVKL